MKNSLEKISLARILTVEQLQKLQHKLLIDDFLADAGLEIRRFQKPQEKFIHKLEPGEKKKEVKKTRAI